MGFRTFIFVACIWWVWRHRNLMCLNNETWSLNRISFNIQSIMKNLKMCFVVNSNVILGESHIKWNKNNHSCTILNTDGSCMGSPIRAGYGGGFRHSVGYYLSGFSGYNQGSSDIVHAKLYDIYQGLLLAKNLGIEEHVCYSDSWLCVNLLKDPTPRFHVYAVLIKDVKDKVILLFVTLSKREINVRISWPSLEPPQIMICSPCLPSGWSLISPKDGCNWDFLS